MGESPEVIEMPRDTVDINELVDVDEVDGLEGEIQYGEFELIDGRRDDRATLIYREDGMEMDTSANWGVSMYSGGHYNGLDVPISELDAIQILDNLSDGDMEGYNWAAYEWTYFE